MVQSKKEVIYYFILNFTSKTLTYILLLVFANLFIPKAYGKASFVYAIFSILIIFVFIGLPDIFITWLIKKKNTYSVFYFLVILTAVALIGSTVVIYFLNALWALPLFLALPFLLFQKIGLTSYAVKHKYHLVQFFGLLFMALTLGFVLILRGFGERGIIWGYALGYIITSLLVLFLARKFIFNITSKVQLHFPAIREYFRKSIITSLLGLFFAFLSWIDVTILGVLSTFENVASYSIISLTTAIITVISITLYQFLLTRTAEVTKEELSSSILNRVLRISFSFSIVFAVVLMSLMTLILEIFFPKYPGLEIFIMILMIGMSFYSIYSLLTIYLIGKLQPEKAFNPIIIAAILNIALDVILVIKFDLYGIVIATTIAHITAFTLLGYKVGLLRRFAPIYFFPIFIVLSFFIGYFGLLLIFPLILALFYLRLIKVEDLRVITSTIREIIKK